MGTNSLQVQLDDATLQLEQLKTKCDTITENINKLNAALPQLQTYYDEFCNMMYDTNVDETDVSTWNGETHKKFVNDVNDGLGTDLKVYTNMYYNNVITPISDKIDALYIELGDLEDQCDSLNSRIQSYQNQLEWEKKQETAKAENDKKNNTKKSVKSHHGSSHRRKT